MNPDFNAATPDDSPTGSAVSKIESLPARDRFELLSAYMDGEVTAAERRQVEEWLASDPTAQKLHQRLLSLRDGFQSLPIPAAETSNQQTIDRVLARIDRRPKLRLMWGGAALAAGLVAAISMFVGGEGTFQTAVAPSKSLENTNQPAQQEAILVALDKPVISIPKAPRSMPAMVQNAVEPAKSGN